MAVNESSRLHASLKKENVPVQRLIVNQVLPESASDCKFCSMKRKVTFNSWCILFIHMQFVMNKIVFHDPILQDQMHALDMIRNDPELGSLTLTEAPLVDAEIRGVPALRFMGDMVWK